MRRVRVGTVGAGLLTLLLVGCGESTVGGGGASSGPGQPPSARTELTIVVRESAGATPKTWTLTCDPAGGTHPDPAGACAALAAVKAPFAPLPSDLACTQIYGGPQTATVTGTYRGKPVNTTFSRTDGCQIARWDGLQALLVVRGGA